MPRYDYHCPDNDYIVEVRHGVNERIKPDWFLEGVETMKAIVLPFVFQAP